MVYSVTKPGRCPTVSYSTRCEKECETDAECPGEHKCCDNGCGTSCLEPASEEPLVTSPPTYNLTAPPYGAEPAAIQQPTEPHVSGEEGGYVSMKCIATGNPTPIITWRKDATVVSQFFFVHLYFLNSYYINILFVYLFKISRIFAVFLSIKI